MINLEQIKAYFRGAIVDSSIFPAGSAEWENKVFDPEGKALWMRESYLNVDEGFSDSTNGDAVQGILSYSINVPIGTYDQEVGGKAVALGSLFPTATTITTEDYKISIDSTSRSFQGVISAGSKWYTIVIDVAFKAYEADLIRSTPIFELDATKNLEFSSGNFIERWNDANFNGLFVRQTTGGSQPIGDGTRVVFDGLDDALIGSSLPVSGEITVVIHTRVLAPLGGGSRMIQCGSAVGEGFAIGLPSGTTSKLTLKGSNNEVAADVPDLLERDAVIVVVFLDGSVKCYIDGVLEFVQAGWVAGGIVPTIDPTYISRLASPAAYIHAEFLRFQIYNKAISEAEITKITEELT